MVKQLKEIFKHIIEIANENIQATIASTICFFWLAAKLITWKLWVTDRIFPLVPPADFLQVPAFIHWVLFVASIILLLCIMAWPTKKHLLITLLIIELISCLFDQNRWQPWEYQYIFTLFILCINQQKHIAKVYIFLLSLIYILSGINKFHPNFLWMVWDNMILQGFFKVPKSIAHQSWLYQSGYILALLEFCGGIALLYAPYRKKAAILLIAMHLFILLFVGPLGLRYNKVIWPWNICMLVQLAIVAWPNKQPIIHYPTLFYGWNKLVFLCWGVLPLLSFFGLWDNYLSSNLYSGTLPKAVVCVADTSTTTNINKYFNKKDGLHKCDGKALINLQTWSMTEMEAPVYPQMRVYKKIEKYWLTKFPDSQPSFIYY